MESRSDSRRQQTALRRLANEPRKLSRTLKWSARRGLTGSTPALSTYPPESTKSIRSVRQWNLLFLLARRGRAVKRTWLKLRVWVRIPVLTLVCSAAICATPPCMPGASCPALDGVATYYVLRTDVRTTNRCAVLRSYCGRARLGVVRCHFDVPVHTDKARASRLQTHPTHYQNLSLKKSLKKELYVLARPNPFYNFFLGRVQTFCKLVWYDPAFNVRNLFVYRRCRGTRVPKHSLVQRTLKSLTWTGSTTTV